MADDMDEVLNFEQFQQLLAEVSGLDSTGIERNAQVKEQLGLDSLGMLELLIALDAALEPSRVYFDEATLDSVVTVGDLYLQYCAQVSKPPDETTSQENRWAARSLKRGRLEGNRISLRPIANVDLQDLYDIACSESVGFTWRYQGIIPTFETFVAQLRQDVLVQYCVKAFGRGNPLGLVSAYGMNTRGNYCYVAAYLDGAGRRSGMGGETICVFANYLFSIFPLQKIYIEAPEFSLPQYRRIIDRDYAVEEGRLRAHYFLDGRRWDQHILAIYREGALKAWNELMSGGERTDRPPVASGAA